MAGEVSVGTLEATLSILAETDSLEQMDAALKELEQTLGVTREAVQANEDAFEQQKEAQNAIAISLEALGISYNQYEQVLAQTAEAAKLAAEVEKDHGDALAENAKRAEESIGPFEKLKNVLVGGGSLKEAFEAVIELPAAVVGAFMAIKEGVEAVWASMVKLGERAEQLKNKSLIFETGVEGLQKLEAAAKTAGISFEMVTMSFMRLDAAAEKNGKAFQKLGMDANAFKALDLEGKVAAVGAALEKETNATTRSAMAKELLGRTGARLLPFFSAYADGAGDMITLTEEQADAAAEFDDALDKMKIGYQSLTEQMTATITSMPIVTEATSAFSEVIYGLAGAFKDAGPTFSDFLTFLIEGGKWINPFLFGISKLIPELNNLAAARAKMQGEIGAFNAQEAEKQQAYLDKWVKTWRDAKTPISDVFAQIGKLREAGALGEEQYKTLMDRVTKDFMTANAAQEKAAEKTAKKNADVAIREAKRAAVEAEKLFMEDGKARIDAYAKQMEANQKIEEAAKKKADAEMKSIEEAMEANRVARELEVFGAEKAERASYAVAQAKIKESAAMAQANLQAAKFGSLMSGIAELGNIFGGNAQVAAQMAGNIGDGVKSLQGLNQKLLESKSATETAAIKQEIFTAKVGMGAAAASALGGALANSKNAMVAQAGAALQAGAAGAKMGAAFGPVGAIIGGVGGAIMGFINKGKQLKAEVTKLYDEFVKSAGGMDQLEKQAKEAGVSLEEVFKLKGTKNVQGMKDAIEKVNKELANHQKMLDDAKEGSDKLSSAMERYGITIEQLGPKFRQQKLDEMAKPLLEDWTLLAQAGVDVNTLVAAFGPIMDENGKIAEENGKLMIGNMNEYINTAVRAGATIPEAMKPSIQALFEQGKLLHENGDAFTQAEFDALQYGKSQEEMFTSLIDKITQLVNAMLGIPTEINTTVTTTHRDVNAGGGGPAMNDDGTRDYDGDPTNSFAAGSGGFRNFGTGTPAILHGTERVQTKSQAIAEQADVAGAIAAAVAQQTAALSKAFRDAVIRGV